MSKKKKRSFCSPSTTKITSSFSFASLAHLVLVGRCGGTLLGRWGVGGA